MQNTACVVTGMALSIVRWIPVMSRAIRTRNTRAAAAKTIVYPAGKRSFCLLLIYFPR